MLKNYLIGATDILKHNHKSKYVHRGYGMAFDGSRGFGDDFARNVVVFCVKVLVLHLVQIIVRIVLYY